MVVGQLRMAMKEYLTSVIIINEESSSVGHYLKRPFNNWNFDLYFSSR